MGISRSGYREFKCEGRIGSWRLEQLYSLYLIFKHKLTAKSSVYTLKSVLLSTATDVFDNKKILLISSIYKMNTTGLTMGLCGTPNLIKISFEISSLNFVIWSSFTIRCEPTHLLIYFCIYFKKIYIQIYNSMSTAVISY